MTISYTPCRPEHVKYIQPLPIQAEEHKALLMPEGADLIVRSMGLTAWHNSRCLGMAGICQIWPGRAEAWALFSHDTGQFMRPVLRHVRFVLDSYQCRRIEISVKSDNAEGHKVARLLGFGEPEGILRAYHPDGSDMHIYARIRR